MTRLSNTNRIFYPALALSVFFSSTASSGQRLGAEELNDLLIGNFMKIVYVYQGKGIEMWEYYQKNGTVAGSTDKWGDYSGTYEIIENGQICLNYSSEDYSGCYFYERVAEDEYKIVDLPWPENTTLNVTVVPGQSVNINAQ